MQALLGGIFIPRSFECFFETCSFSSKIKQLRKVQNKLNATIVRETRNLSFSVLLMIWREVVQIMSKSINIPLKAPLNVNKENLWKLTAFLKFIAKMGVGEETSISKDAGNYFFSDVSLSKIQISLFRTNVKYRHIERKENCPDGRRSQKDDSHTVFRWTCCTYLEQSTYHSQQRVEIFFSRQIKVINCQTMQNRCIFTTSFFLL